MRKLLFVIFSLGCLSVSGQELNCQVQVVSNQVQQSDRRIFETLQKAIYEFVNTTKWTNDQYQLTERIECSMFINITERVSADEFKATIQVQSRRPVYKTSYNTTLLNINDQDFTFKYIEFQPLQFSEATMLANLTSVLAFYSYMIIAVDYETFSPNGGEVYFQKALAIVNNAQGAVESGWKQFESTNNRYWLIENFLNPRFKLMRDTYYKYHRLGMDVMTADMESGRRAITECLDNIKKVRQDQQNAYLLRLWFNSKADELVNVYSSAFPDVKAKAVAVLTEVDPGNANKYKKILTASSQ
ncbi:MAG: hypothetical protein POELPBGB_03835 [Bacteroidia bacterium]|nr:hypothetical protein [Bacteroidia bacterium]